MNGAGNREFESRKFSVAQKHNMSGIARKRLMAERKVTFSFGFCESWLSLLVDVLLTPPYDSSFVYVIYLSFLLFSFAHLHCLLWAAFNLAELAQKPSSRFLRKTRAEA